MKKMIKMISMMTAAILAATSLTACGVTSVPHTDVQASDGALTYISMRINPEIEVVADENGEIVSVNAMNEDGEVVLAEIDLVGQTVAEAGESFTQIATELGYLDADSEDATVYIDAEGENEELNEKLEQDISDRIHKYFDNNGIFGKVSPETLEQYAEQAAQWGLSTGQTKMVIRLLDLYPEMTEEEALALTTAERMSLIKDSGKKEEKIAASLREEMKTQVDAIKEKYAATFALGEEIKTLSRSLEDDTLTADEKSAIEAEIAEKKAVYEEQMRAYRDEIKALKASYHTKTDRAENDAKKVAKEKREKNADKIKQHKENFEADPDMTREKIREWRGQQENVKGGNRGDAEKERRGDDNAEEQTVQTDISESSVDQEKAPKQGKTEKDKVKTTEETTVPA